MKEEREKKKYQRERKTSIGCLLYVPQPEVLPATYLCALTKNRTHNFLMYGIMLQPTWPYQLGHYIILIKHFYVFGGFWFSSFYFFCLYTLMWSTTFYLQFCSDPYYCIVSVISITLYILFWISTGKLDWYLVLQQGQVISCMSFCCPLPFLGFIFWISVWFCFSFFVVYCNFLEFV